MYLKAYLQNLVQKGSVISEKSKVMTLGHGQEMTLTLNTNKPSSTQLVVCIYQLSGHRMQ